MWQEEIRRFLQSHDRINIIIAGSTCSGKTTLANEIRSEFQKEEAVTIVTQDDYFKDICDMPRGKEGYLTDSIEAFHKKEFQQDVAKLLRDGVVWMPRYDMKSNTRISKNKLIRASKMNVIEGLHTITLLEKLPHSVTIFVDTKIEICLKRRIARDTVQYKIPEAVIREHWKKCIIPMYQKDILPQKETADWILTEGGILYDNKGNL